MAGGESTRDVPGRVNVASRYGGEKVVRQAVVKQAPLYRKKVVLDRQWQTTAFWSRKRVLVVRRPKARAASGSASGRTVRTFMVRVAISASSADVLTVVLDATAAVRLAAKTWSGCRARGLRACSRLVIGVGVAAYFANVVGVHLEAPLPECLAAGLSAH